MASHAEGLAAKEIANRLQRDVKTVRKIIGTTKLSPLSATPPTPRRDLAGPN
jgi:hypothetical protein